MLTGSIMIVKNATLCWPTRVTSYIFISRSFPSSSTILVLEYIELSIISNMLFFYKFSSSMEIVVLLILFRQHFFFYFILGTMYLVLFDHCTTKLKMMMEEGIPALIASEKQWRLFKRSFDIFSCRSSHHVKNRFHFPIFTLYKCSHLHF